MLGGHHLYKRFGARTEPCGTPPCIYLDVAHVKLVHCQHGMARPRAADRGDGLQIWRVAANTLNKQ
jgi:hypothetical protein